MRKNLFFSILVASLFVISLNLNSISIEVDKENNNEIYFLETDFKISPDGDGIVGIGDIVDITYWLSLYAFYDEEGATPVDGNCPNQIGSAEAGVGIFIEGFDNALLGMHVNETKRVYISAADNPYTGFLADQDLYFVIQIDALIIDYDKIQPKVTDIHHSPENVTNNDVVTIYCNATDTSGIKSVILTYRISINDEIGNWQEVELTLTYISNIYSAEIGEFETDSLVQYYLTATDNAEEENTVMINNSGAYYGFAVIYYDRIQPKVTDIHHSPENVTNNDLITIYCNATDTSGIKSVILSYRVSINDKIGNWQEVEMTLTNVSNIYSAEIGEFETDSLVQYYLTATDNAEEENTVMNNNSGAYYSFIVEVIPSVNWQLPLSIIGLVTIGIIVSRRKK